MRYAAAEFSYATMLGRTLQDLPDTDFDDTMPVVTHKAMMHMALKQGLKEFGLTVKEAVLRELMQIHMQNTFAPKHYNELTPEQR